MTYSHSGDRNVVTSDGICRYPLRCLNRGDWVVSQISKSSGANLSGAAADHTWVYSYANGLMDAEGWGGSDTSRGW